MYFDSKGKASIKNESDLKEYIIKLAQNGIKIIRLDAVGYTIQLDESILASIDYYLDDNGVPFTDAGLTTFIGIGAITNESVDGIENIDSDSEFEVSEGIGITEDVEDEQEVETSETINLSESIYVEDEQETDEIINGIEDVTFHQGDADQWTKSNPTSNDNWVKNSNGDIV